MDPHDMMRSIAQEVWEAHRRQDVRPLPLLPGLAIFVGVPLAGKSTLVRRFVADVPTRTLHVENDDLRQRIACALGRQEPSYDHEENLLTYRTAWSLLGIGLSAGSNVVHDATSLTESGRKGAYEEADERGVPVAVVYVETARPILEARAAAAPQTRQEAYAKLGRKQPNPQACSRPTVMIDGGLPAEVNVRILEEEPRLLPFVASSRPYALRLCRKPSEARP